MQIKVFERGGAAWFVENEILREIGGFDAADAPEGSKVLVVLVPPDKDVFVVDDDPENVKIFIEGV